MLHGFGNTNIRDQPRANTQLDLVRMRTIHSNGLSNSLVASATDIKAAERSDTRMIDLPTRMDARILMSVLEHKINDLSEPP